MLILAMCTSRKYPLPPTYRRDLNFLEVGGSVRPQNLKKCVKLFWNFQRGGGLRQNPFCGGSMDIFWYYAISLNVVGQNDIQVKKIPLSLNPN